MKNVNLIRKKEADRWFVRNKGSLLAKDEKILDLIKINSIKANNILEIGCANGDKLNQYSKLCKSKKSYGVDLSNLLKKKIEKSLVNLLKITINLIHI